MVKFLVMDVDGTLTDGKVYMGCEGESFKAFDVKDGVGIKVLLPKYGIIPVVITARKSQILVNRCKELGVVEVYQGVCEKLDCIEQVVSKYTTSSEKYSLQDVAYIGDDIIDLPCLKAVKDAGGFASCPADSALEVIACCDYVTKHKGGQGAVRELVEYLVSNGTDGNNEGIKDKINRSLEYINNLDIDNVKSGLYVVSDDFYYCVQEYCPQNDDSAVYESHKKHIDIQFLISGTERLYVTNVNNLIPMSYNSEKDIVSYKTSNNQSSMVMTSGSYAILFPEDAHRSGRFLNRDCQVKKIVGKIVL